MNRKTLVLLIVLLPALAVLPLWAGGSKGVVRPEVAAVLNDYLESVWGEGQVVWTPNSPHQFGLIPDDAEVSVVPRGRPKGSTVINLDVKREGRLIKRLPLSLRVLPFAWVPVAKKDVDSREVLKPENIRWQREEVTRTYGTWPEKPEEFRERTWWARRTIRRGDILTYDRIEPRPEIARGDFVEMVSVKGGVIVSTDGIALQDGRIGDRVKVENPASGARLLGIVDGERVVMIRGVDRAGRR